MLYSELADDCVAESFKWMNYFINFCITASSNPKKIFFFLIKFTFIEIIWNFFQNKFYRLRKFSVSFYMGGGGTGNTPMGGGGGTPLNI